jgi:beta-glucosidase
MLLFRKQLLGAFLAWSSVSPIVLGQAVPAEKANDVRVDKLLHQLTLEEKMNLIRSGAEDPALYQGEAGYLPGVPRLHIPSLRFADGPPGLLIRVPAQAETATMGVAATFSIKDASANGSLQSRSAFARHRCCAATIHQ